MQHPIQACYTGKMITVIIAGGSGTRLWPLSTSNNPKQLLKLTNDYTMVQNTYNRATTFSKEIFVVPDVSHAHLLRDQLRVLDDSHCVVEPGRRGTANCIVAALAHISKMDIDKDEPIAFISADHHVRDVAGFARTFSVAGDVSTSKGRIALIGIEPTFPATGFGYIERSEELGDTPGAYSVESFKEKPDFETAREYMQSGHYLWNCGYFVGSVNTFLKEMKENAPKLAENYDKLCAIDDSESQEYKDTYLGFENEVIDIALIERAKELVVVPASFDWMDVGNFNDLHAANELDQLSNYVQGENIHSTDVENGYIRNEEPEKPVVVIGMDNVVVVNTKDGILVSRKDLSPKVGDIAKKIQAS